MTTQRLAQPTTHDLGHLLLEIATTQAVARNADPRSARGPYVDTGLTPAELYDLCILELAQGPRDDPVAEGWAPLVFRALDHDLQEGLFRFHVSVQEALGRLRVLDDGLGERRVFVTREVLQA